MYRSKVVIYLEIIKITLWLFGKKDGIDENSTVDGIRDLIIFKYSNRVVLNKTSQIEIVKVS